MASKKQLVDLDFGSISRIRNLQSPANPDEPVRLQDLNQVVEGLKQKEPVVAATQGNTNLASPGATIDGVVMVVGNRVLVKAQTLPAQNGIYSWTGAASAMTRTLDSNVSAELNAALVQVYGGANANQNWRQTATLVTLDTDSVTWVQFGTSVANASTSTPGIVQLATQAEVDSGVDASKSVTPATLAGAANRKLKLSQNIGDGSATQYDVTHNFGTRDVAVNVYAVASYDNVECAITRFDINTVRLNFNVAPTTNQYRVVVLG